MVNTIADQGVRVEVVGLRSMTSASLINVANCYIDLAAIQQTVQKLDGSMGVHPSTSIFDKYF